MLVVNYQTWVMGISQNSVLSKAIETIWSWLGRWSKWEARPTRMEWMILDVHMTCFLYVFWKKHIQTSLNHFDTNMKKHVFDLQAYKLLVSWFQTFHFHPTVLTT